MKKLLTICMAVLFCMAIHADEGMWVIQKMSDESIQKMRDLGFDMDMENLYNETESPSLTDAIVQLNIGCTGISVSKDGLIFTNHHCGYNAIQSLSSVEHDYLTDGFVSQSFAEELPVPGMTMRYYVTTIDVTDKILTGISDDLDEEKRVMDIYEKVKALEKEMNESMTGFDVEVDAYYADNAYYANVYRKFTDIRLVFAPPSSIGKFGGDTDNWMWPRQTGDFSVFRVYANSNNEPADYAPENRPYNPPYVAPISINGYEDNSFAMIMGFPGSTVRYLSSWGVEQRMNSSNAPRIEVRGIKQVIWQEAMREDAETRIKYSSKYAGSSNYWKNSIGMNRGIEKMGVIPRKQALEREFSTWLSRNKAMNDKYGEALPLIENGYTSTKDLRKDMTYLQEAVSGAEMLFLAYSLSEAVNAKDNPISPNLYEEMRYDNFFKNYSPELDKKTLGAMLEIVKKRLPANRLPAIYTEIDKKYKGDYHKYAADVFKKSVIPYPDKLKATLKDKKAADKIKKDPAYQLASSMMEKLMAFRTEFTKANFDIHKGERLFMTGLMEMHPEKDYPSDANFTLRLTYGTVGGYEPYDGAWYDYYTTPKGIFEKYVKDDPEFNVQPEILQLLRRGDFKPYADKDGTMHVNFLSNNDITGGNSGSPIFDGKGRVIGLAFDGNWEAMSGDIAFEADIQKTINVDIRYVLYIIEKWGKAKRIIDELRFE